MLSLSQKFTNIQDITSLEENELTTVKGILALQPDCVQYVPMKDGFFLPMLERCAISDHAGMTRLTLWGNAIDEVVNLKCYTITNFHVKVFNSRKYLTSTPQTKFTITEDAYDPPSEQAFSACTKNSFSR